MVVTGSVAEREIRDAAAGFFRAQRPDARIIHELVVGGCRADLAVVQTERIALVEIKSSRDTLKRLAEQVRQFKRASHEVIVIADEKWFDRTPYNNGMPRFVPSDALQDGAPYPAEIWAYPEDKARRSYRPWHMPHWRAVSAQPHAARLLELLWKSELLAECFRHRISVSSRTTCPVMIRDMAWHMTGAEIARAVCRQLRQREFPEADAPIVERLAA